MKVRELLEYCYHESRIEVSGKDHTIVYQGNRDNVPEEIKNADLWFFRPYMTFPKDDVASANLLIFIK